MRDNPFMLVKLPNGAYILLSGEVQNVSVSEMMMALYGIRSGKNSVVITTDLFRRYSIATLGKYISEKLPNIEKVFMLYDEKLTGDLNGVIRQNYLPYFIRNGIGRKYIIWDSNKWIEDNHITQKQKEWFGKVVEGLFSNQKFITGQLSSRLKLQREKRDYADMEERLKKRKEEYENMRGPEEQASSNIRNIKRMRWIDSLETTPSGDLRILTKSMACTMVPNIGEYVRMDKIKESDVLYRMMKYQLMGKYFIIMPDYYIIKQNYNIVGDNNHAYPVTKAREIVMNSTYFRGQACHIGNGNACLGELSTAVSQARKTGLDMLLMSFEAYLRSINLTDAAGQRYYCLPMGDAEGNIEVWPYVETVMKKRGISFKNKKRSLETYEELLNTPQMKECGTSFGKYFDGECMNLNKIENMRACINLIKKREPKLYKELEQKGAFAQWQ